MFDVRIPGTPHGVTTEVQMKAGAIDWLMTKHKLRVALPASDKALRTT